jgi:ketosteroid isomerase-like protein
VSSPTLDARIARLEAVAQIRQLASRYAAAFAASDFDALVQLFEPDVRVSRDAHGRAALLDQFRTSMRVGEPTAVKITILHVGNHVIDLVGDDHATGEVYCHGEMQRADGTWFHQAIHYGDTYVRQGTSWFFARRKHQLFYGAEPVQRPNGLPTANWPQHDEGTGTLPYAWPSWQEFWAPK